MTIEPGEYAPVPGCTDLYYLDTEMYGAKNYGSVYLLDAERPAVIDTGIGNKREYLFDALDDLGMTPEWILPTHVHLDHAGGAGFLAERYPEATVTMHESAVEHLVDPTRLVAGTRAAVGIQWEYYVEPEPIPEERIQPLSGGETLDLGDRALDVHHAPGHAPHQVIFHDRGDDVVFTADAAGIYVPQLDEIRQTSPPSRFDLHGCQADADTIRDIDPRYLCFGHFGPKEFHDEDMAEYKRTLAEWVEAVRQKRAELGDDDAVIAHFAEHAPEDTIEVWGERKAREEEKMNTRGVLTYLDYMEKHGKTV